VKLRPKGDDTVIVESEQALREKPTTFPEAFKAMVKVAMARLGTGFRKPKHYGKGKEQPMPQGNDRKARRLRERIRNRADRDETRKLHTRTQGGAWQSYYDGVRQPSRHTKARWRREGR